LLTRLVGKNDVLLLCADMLKKVHSMANFRISFTLLLLVLIVYNSALADTEGYWCTVKTELHLSKDGALKPYPNPLAVGIQFAVDRITGKIIGSNTSWWFVSNAKISVLSHGNMSSSFVATYTLPMADNGVNQTTLCIDEYSRGILKPFLLTSQNSVYAGVCK
jgi:hypothetical protein